MSKLNLTLCFALGCLTWSGLCAAAGPAQDPVDGPHRIFEDALLDQLVGEWELTGDMLGRQLHQRVKVEWVLNHQFLRIHFRDEERPAGIDFDYEAETYIGFDHGAGQYVMHLMDVFGGRASKAVGVGSGQGDRIHFIFDYEAGPFHTTLVRKSTDEWEMVLDSVQQGEVKRFATKILRRHRN